MININRVTTVPGLAKGDVGFSSLWTRHTTCFSPQDTISKLHFMAALEKGKKGGVGGAELQYL